METTALTQGEIDFNLAPPDWVALRVLLGKIEEELVRRRSHLLFNLSNWFLAVDIFHQFEDEKMILSEPALRDGKYHRVFLTHLMAHGERLLMELENHSQEIDPLSIGIKMENVHATVEELRLTYAEWYGDMTPQRRAEIMEEIFGSPKE